MQPRWVHTLLSAKICCWPLYSAFTIQTPNWALNFSSHLPGGEGVGEADLELARRLAQHVGEHEPHRAERPQRERRRSSRRSRPPAPTCRTRTPAVRRLRCCVRSRCRLRVVRLHRHRRQRRSILWPASSAAERRRRPSRRLRPWSSGRAARPCARRRECFVCRRGRRAAAASFFAGAALAAAGFGAGLGDSFAAGAAGSRLAFASRGPSPECRRRSACRRRPASSQRASRRRGCGSWRLRCRPLQLPAALASAGASPLLICFASGGQHLGHRHFAFVDHRESRCRNALGMRSWTATANPFVESRAYQLSHLVAAPTSGGQSIDVQQVIATEPRRNQGFVTFFTIFPLGVMSNARSLSTAVFLRHRPATQRYCIDSAHCQDRVAPVPTLLPRLVESFTCRRFDDARHADLVICN